LLEPLFVPQNVSRFQTVEIEARLSIADLPCLIVFLVLPETQLHSFLNQFPLKFGDTTQNIEQES